MKKKGKNPQLYPLLDILPFFGYTARMSLFSRISTSYNPCTFLKKDFTLQMWYLEGMMGGEGGREVAQNTFSWSFKLKFTFSDRIRYSVNLNV